MVKGRWIDGKAKKKKRKKKREKEEKEKMRSVIVGKL